MAFNTRLENLLKSDTRFIDDNGELLLAAVQANFLAPEKKALFSGTVVFVPIF